MVLFWLNRNWGLDGWVWVVAFQGEILVAEAEDIADRRVPGAGARRHSAERRISGG